MSKRFYFDEFSEDIFDDEIQQYPSNQTICNILNQQQERISELEEQLKNAIVPKFKVGQKVWFIDNEKDIQECEIYELKLNRYVRKLVYNISYNIGLEDWTDDVAFEDELFATKEEAQAKLEKLKGENNANNN